MVNDFHYACTRPSLPFDFADPFSWAAHYYWKQSFNQATGFAWSSCHLYPHLLVTLMWLSINFPQKLFEVLSSLTSLCKCTVDHALPGTLCSPVITVHHHFLDSLSHSPESAFKFRSSYIQVPKSSFLGPSLFPSLYSFPRYQYSISVLQLFSLDRILALMTSCMASGKLIHFSLFTHLLNGDNGIYLIELLWRLNEVTRIRYLPRAVPIT